MFADAPRLSRPPRLVERLPRSGFRDRLIAKGRFADRMDAMPVKLVPRL